MNGETATLSVRSRNDVNILFVASSGDIVDGDNVASSSSFVADREDEYFLYFVGGLGQRDDVSISLEVAAGDAAPTARPQYVLLDFDGTDRVELSSGVERVGLAETDLKAFGETVDERELLGQIQSTVEKLICERLQAIFAPYAIHVIMEQENAGGNSYSTVYFTQNEGPLSGDTFETVTPASATDDDDCAACILYGEAGPDLGNGRLDDDAIVYVGSFVGIPPTSISDWVNLMAHAAAHEIGHLLGLQHIRRSTDIMWGRFDVGFLRDIGFGRGQVVINEQLVEFLFQNPERYLERIVGLSP
ncbi:MAG: hypothetical protein JSU86_18545 [Phycisphaerales bacterium]|nr:MAG: hypothetical protein JSU86_18545 [Phycisphaerales bacterium]